MFDKDDREFVLLWAIRFGGAVVAVMGAGAALGVSLGLGVRLFHILAG